jgi:urease accessory protein
MTMDTEAPGWLELIWLASPALPVGGFSYSEGLESAIEHGRVHDEPSCEKWLLAQMRLTQARGDWALVAQAIRAWRCLDIERLTALARWLDATRESAEIRLQSEQMGRSMQDWLRNLGQVDAAQLDILARLPPHYAMAQALALSRVDAPIEQALQTLAFAWAENMVQAAVKSIPLGQHAGQRVLLALRKGIPAAVDTALNLSDEHRQCFSPMWAILSSRHETQYSRLFRS